MSKADLKAQLNEMTLATLLAGVDYPEIGVTDQELARSYLWVAGVLDAYRINQNMIEEGKEKKDIMQIQTAAVEAYKKDLIARLEEKYKWPGNILDERVTETVRNACCEVRDMIREGK